MAGMTMVTVEIMILTTDMKEMVIIIQAMEMAIATRNYTNRICLIRAARSKVFLDRILHEGKRGE
jgi:hypothetical protein